MNTVDIVRDLMHAIRDANPDVDTIEVEGVREKLPRISDGVIFTDIELLRWKTRISFNDGDWFETRLYEDSIDSLEEARRRLSEWMR